MVSDKIKNVSEPRNNKFNNFNVLEDVLNTLRFKGCIFFHSNLAKPWGIELPAISNPRFHIALNGNFSVGNSDLNIQVNHMDIAVLPQGNKHWIADQSQRSLTPASDVLHACNLDSPLFQRGQLSHRVMCGMIEYEQKVSHPIITALPEIFKVSIQDKEHKIWKTITLIDNEIKESNQYSNIIIDKFTEILFILLLEKYILDNKQISGFLGVLQHPRLKMGLQLIHQQPEYPWTLEILSKRIAMSRATLVRKFNAELGVSPITYINQWRMIKAYQLLQYSDLDMEDIASKVGFGSSRTLTKAFQRQFELSPVAVRKQI